MAQKRKARELTVTAAVQLTPNMRRVTLRGEDLADFPDDAEGAYLKLVFPGADPERPAMRTYTVARHRPDRHEIDVDFMLHADPDGTPDGIAAAWAVRAREGDRMAIFGPGGASFVNTDADWYLLAADMTALPALTASLRRLPATATGHVVIEILAEEDRQELPLPASMDVLWVVNPRAGSEQSPLHDAVRRVAWLDGRVAVWLACEFETMRKCRRYLRDERGVGRSHLYLSSYWKKGLREEAHKVAKREDAG